MNRTVLVLVITLSTLLAGCLGPRIGAGRVDDLAATDGVGNLTLVPDRFRLAGCDEILGVFPIPASFTADLPKGFKPVYSDPAGATAVMVAIGWKCGKGEIPAKATFEGDVALVGGILVTPTAEYKAENAIAHLVLVGYTTANPALASLLKAWHVSAEEPAKRKVTDFLVGGPVRSGLITLDAVTLSAQASGPEEVDKGGSIRYFRAEKGEVVGAFDLTWNQARAFVVGRAHVEFEGGLAGIAPSSLEGQGVHVWGQTYAYNVTRVDFATASNATSTDTATSPAATPLARLLAGRLNASTIGLQTL